MNDISSYTINSKWVTIIHNWFLPLACSDQQPWSSSNLSDLYLAWSFLDTNTQNHNRVTQLLITQHSSPSISFMPFLMSFLYWLLMRCHEYVNFNSSVSLFSMTLWRYAFSWAYRESHTTYFTNRSLSPVLSWLPGWPRVKQSLLLSLTLSPCPYCNCGRTS